LRIVARKNTPSEGILEDRGPLHALFKLPW